MRKTCKKIIRDTTEHNLSKEATIRDIAIYLSSSMKEIRMENALVA